MSSDTVAKAWNYIFDPDAYSKDDLDIDVIQANAKAMLVKRGCVITNGNEMDTLESFSTFCPSISATYSPKLPCAWWRTKAQAKNPETKIPDMLKLYMVFVTLPKHKKLTKDLLRTVIEWGKEQDHLIVVAHQVHKKVCDQYVQEHAILTSTQRVEVYATQSFERNLLEHVYFRRTNPVLLSPEDLPNVVSKIITKDSEDWIQNKPTCPLVCYLGGTPEQHIFFAEQSRSSGFYPNLRYINDKA